MFIQPWSGCIKCAALRCRILSFGWDSGSTAQLSTAQHSTAQHTSALHSIAHLSTAQLYE